MSNAIGDYERRCMGPQSPCALRITAVRCHFLRWCSSPMRSGIAFVAPPWIWPRSARNAARTITRTGSWHKECRMLDNVAPATVVLPFKIL